jgi:hypothetical protein
MIGFVSPPFHEQPARLIRRTSLTAVGRRGAEAARWHPSSGSLASAMAARLLEPFFARPAAWRVLDIVSGLLMAGLAISLTLTLR